MATASSRPALPADPLRDGADVSGAEGLYVHLPFCTIRCGYCDFATGPYEEDRADRYLEALDRELTTRPPAAPQTIYLGGGTPTALTADQLRRLDAILDRRVDRSEVVETTAEANPRSLDAARAEALRDLGVDRVSIGAQSFDPRHLATLDRDHEPSEVARAVRTAREAGFRSVSLDLIWAIPGQTPADLERDLEAALELDPDHVSAYGLIYEPGTPLTHRLEAGAVEAVPEEESAAMMDLLLDRLREAGRPPYEIGNFARPGHACRHNGLYWSGAAYLGLGAGAHSFAGGAGARLANTRNIPRYVALCEERGRAVVEVDRLEPAARARELLMLGLRRVEGVRLSTIARRTGVDPAGEVGAVLDDLVDEGLVAREEEGDLVRLAGRGLRVADAVFRAIL